MKIEKYISGVYKEQFKYKSFSPTLINEQWIWEDASLSYILDEATRKLAELDMYSKLISNVDLYIKMHVRVEANKSSKIEGTRTSIEEDLMDKEEILPEKRDDWEEVQNYIKAMNYGVEKIASEFPLCSRLIREMHALLLSGVRGEHKQPGEFRKSQNWIGGSSISDAVYIPPHETELGELISDLEKFINNENIQVPHLIKSAIIHYQFEILHPFLDGNGRIGRLLIPLYIQSKGLLEKPALYISDFFERNRDSYYDALSRVRVSNDMLHWIKFFLNGIIEMSEKGRDTFVKIVELKNNIDQKILGLNIKPENAHKIMNIFYNEPKASVQKLIEITGMSKSTMSVILRKLEENNIISETTGYRKNKIYVFDEYIKLFTR